MRINYSTIFLVTILTVLIGAQNLYAQDENTNNREIEWNSFKAKEGSEWNIRWSEGRDVPRTIYSGLTKDYRGTPEAIARQFLTEYRSLFSMKEGLTDLRHEKTLTHRGVHHVTFQQYYKQLPVYKAEYKVHIRKSGSIDMANGHYYPGISISATPSISEAKANDIVRNDLGLSEQDAFDPKTKLLVYPVTDSTVTLAY